MATQLTDDSRAIAARMQDWERICGNVHMVHQMAGDAATIQSLKDAVDEAAGAPEGMGASLVRAGLLAATVEQTGGNLHLVQALVAAGADVAAAADFLDVPAGPA